MNILYLSSKSVGYPTSGEVAEWLKAHAWNACIRVYRIEGSNPFLTDDINNLNTKFAKDI